MVTAVGNRYHYLFLSLVVAKLRTGGHTLAHAQGAGGTSVAHRHIAVGGQVGYRVSTVTYRGGGYRAVYSRDRRDGLVLHRHNGRCAGLTAVVVVNGHRDITGAVTFLYGYAGTHWVAEFIRVAGAGGSNHYPTLPLIAIRSIGGATNGGDHFLRASGRTNGSNFRNRHNRVRTYGNADGLAFSCAGRFRLIAARTYTKCIYITSSDIAANGGMKIIRAGICQTCRQICRSRNGQCAIFAGNSYLVNVSAGTFSLRARAYRQHHGGVHLNGTGNVNWLASRVRLVAGSLDGIFEGSSLVRRATNGIVGKGHS